MLSIDKYGAIDIGSNAIRLLIANVIERADSPPIFRKSALIRVPIRLGEDVFTDGSISKGNEQRMVDAMQAFQLLMKAHKVTVYRACATSAMREASNGSEVTALIKKETGIQIEIIDGDEEASIIAATDLHAVIKPTRNYLFVDVGGGSTEFTIYSGDKVVASKSFKVGTVRIISGLLTSKDWQGVEDWIQIHTKSFKHIDVVGSGGNINKIFKLSGRKQGKPLSYLFLSNYYKELKKTTYTERVVDMGLNQDRADVIIPAAKIYLSAMKWSGAKDIYVPKIGLSDGIIKSLYFQVKSKSL